MHDETSRERLIESIDDVRTRWRDLVHEVGPDRLEQPGAMGDWTFKDVAAHLTTWRRRTVERLKAAAAGAPEPPPFWPADLGSIETDAINAWIYDRTSQRPASKLLAESDAVYDDFIAAIRSLPLDAVTDPHRFSWLEGISLADSDFGGHLDEHEPGVRRWLANGTGGS